MHFNPPFPFSMILNWVSTSFHLVLTQNLTLMAFSVSLGMTGASSPRIYVPESEPKPTQARCRARPGLGLAWRASGLKPGPESLVISTCPMQDGGMTLSRME
ncbi:hypothetical protein C8F04DRAFT_328360 [Mycena alexandri]|uniref:Uncharacterized protein n=1 Tax=Mycena alexandri TaxID=1745969 RepID=A0AAD6S2P4_9AGAR|nr:hypothetical protein C8F04DRAFT_328360 [Mycena alexandri]